jgi:hypothetical protein
VQSLNNKTDKLEVLLGSDLKCDVLAITEHWLSDIKLKCISLDKYLLVSSYCRKQSIHGGSCIYVKSNVKAVNVPEIVNLSKELVCEISAVNLLEFNIIVICLYRTNLVATKDFLTHLECVLEKANEFSQDFIVVGDMNINCIGERTVELRELEDVLMSHDCRNEITFPTRVIANSSTALDHAYTNVDVGTVTASPVVTNIGDHYAVRLELTGRRKSPTTQTRLVRDYSHLNRANFVLAMESVDWTNFVSSSDKAETLATQLCRIISNKIEICFLFKPKTGTKSKESWVTQNVLNTKSLLLDCVKLYRKFPLNDALINRIHILNNKYNYEIQQCKAQFYSKQMSSTQNSSKSMWEVINKERGKTGRPAVDFTELIESTEGLKFNTKKEVVDAMNTRFIGAAVACGAPCADLDPVRAQLSAARAPADRSMRLTPFTVEEVLTIIIARIPHKTSKDIYGVSMDLFNSIAYTIAPALTHLYNACLRQGSYPKPLKISKISPLFKGKGKRENIDGYRPVSIIPSVAKVLENGLSSRLTAFLDETNALSDRQYAYRSGRCTTDVTREVVRRVLEALESKQQVALICCDLSKAFDVADHTVIATKLRHYGICGNAHSLFTDILRDRSQVVVGDGGQVKSDPMTTSMGVAQGSSVSNILFSLLLNDLPEAITTADILMYADDVAGIVSAPDVDCLETRLNYAESEPESEFLFAQNMVQNR